MTARISSLKSMFTHRTHGSSATQSKPLPSQPAAVPPTASAPTVAKPAPGAPVGAALNPIKEASSSSGKPVSLAGSAPFQAAPGAQLNARFDAQGAKVEKNTLGGTLKAQTGSATLSTVNHHANGAHQQYVQGEVNGPKASFVANTQHAGRLGTTTAQFSAEANVLKLQGQAGYSIDTKNQQFMANASAKAETSVGVAGHVNHDFNEHVSVYGKGTAKASALAVAEGTASFDPKNRTALLSGKVGAGATAEANATFGGHVGRLSASVTLGAVAGAAASASGKVGLERGKFQLTSDVKTAVGVGTHIKTELALDTRHRPKPSIKQGLVNSGLLGLTPALPAASHGPMTSPSHSSLGALFKSSMMATAPGLPPLSDTAAHP
jgi:hypothetical protein